MVKAVVAGLAMSPACLRTAWVFRHKRYSIDQLARKRERGRRSPNDLKPHIRGGKRLQLPSRACTCIQYRRPPAKAAAASGTWADGSPGNDLANVGEIISCTYRIENAGTQSVAELCLVDANIGTECIGCGTASLLPGGYFTCSTAYEVELPLL